MAPYKVDLASAESPSPYPHQPYTRQSNDKSGRKVLALWHFFPITFDNKPEQFDLYSREFLSIEGEKGKHSAYGGFLRDRPIPVSPISAKDWRVSIAKRDITQAIDAGIDGFLFNIASLKTQQGYLSQADNLLVAIDQVSEEFYLAPCLDAYALGRDQTAEEVVAAIYPLMKRSGSLTTPDGRKVLSAFAAENWSPEFWKSIITDLENVGIRVYWMPLFLAADKTTGDHISLCDAYGWWDGNYLAAVDNLVDKRNQARQSGKKFVWPIWPQDMRPKSKWYAEAENSRLFRQGWESAIKSDADFVCVVAWNDYSESAYIRPSIGTQFAFSDLNRYFSDWYKARSTPKVIRDVVFYFHRIDFTYPNLGLSGHPALRMRYGGAPKNNLEAVSFLVAPAEVEMRSGGEVVTYLAPEGQASFTTELQPEVQSVRLIRKGHEIAAATSPFIVRANWEWQDLTYRGGSSARPAEQSSIAHFSK